MSEQSDKILADLERQIAPLYDGDAFVDPESNEVPDWGEEAADIIIKMAAERASHIEAFAESVVKRAMEWQVVAGSLAQSIRETSLKEAQAIRRETSRMLRAGNRIEVAAREFLPQKSHMKAKEKNDGRDRRTSETESVKSPNDPGREPVFGAPKTHPNPTTGTRQGSNSAAREGRLEIPPPAFLHDRITHHDGE